MPQLLGFAAGRPRLRLVPGGGTTVLVALAANAVITAAKLVAGLLSGSAALLAEAVHSPADTVDQLFLLVSLSLSSRPADEEHPLGYGRERFFWALLAAVFMFVAGAAIAIGRPRRRCRRAFAGADRGEARAPRGTGGATRGDPPP